jgi:diguanylate cyclase (GGDEF)-like protein
MKARRTMSLVNVAFMAMIAIAALTSAVSFIWLTEIVRHSVRTATLARELVEGYRRFDLDRLNEATSPEELAARHAALGAKSDELAQRLTSTSNHSTRAMASVAVSSFGTIVAGAVLMVLVSRRIARPLAMILEATDRIADGDFGHRVDYQAADEMGMLAQSFDRMARCLQRSLDELVKHKHTLERRVEEATADLRALSFTDDLTELPNLRHLREAFDDAVRRADAADAPLTIAVVGIDDFRAINDRFGYDAGNLVLVAFARCVRAAARGDDFVARGSGVQFVILMPGLREVPRAFIDQVELGIESVQKLVRHRTGRDVGLTAGFGAACYREDGHSLHALLAAADHALAASRESVRAAPAQGKEPS